MTDGNYDHNDHNGIIQLSRPSHDYGYPLIIEFDDRTFIICSSLKGNVPNDSRESHSTRERSAAANRMSHIFGLTGPTSTAETACWGAQSPSCWPTSQTQQRPKVRRLWWLWALGRWLWGMQQIFFHGGEAQIPMVITIFHEFPHVNHQWSDPDQWINKHSKIKIFKIDPRYSANHQHKAHNAKMLSKPIRESIGRIDMLTCCDECRQKTEDQMNPNIATDLKHGLVVGAPSIFSSWMWSCAMIWWCKAHQHCRLHKSSLNRNGQAQLQVDSWLCDLVWLLHVASCCFMLLHVASNCFSRDWEQHADWTLWLHLLEWPWHADASRKVVSPGSGWEADGKWWKMMENDGKWWKMMENDGKWWKAVPQSLSNRCQMAIAVGKPCTLHDSRLAQEFRMP